MRAGTADFRLVWQTGFSVHSVRDWLAGVRRGVAVCARKDLRAVPVSCKQYRVLRSTSLTSRSPALRDRFAHQSESLTGGGFGGGWVPSGPQNIGILVHSIDPPYTTAGGTVACPGRVRTSSRDSKTDTGCPSTWISRLLLFSFGFLAIIGWPRGKSVPSLLRALVLPPVTRQPRQAG
jgi:hypothetical protein